MVKTFEIRLAPGLASGSLSLPAPIADEATLKGFQNELFPILEPSNQALLITRFKQNMDEYGFSLKFFDADLTLLKTTARIQCIQLYNHFKALFATALPLGFSTVFYELFLGQEGYGVFAETKGTYDERFINCTVLLKKIQALLERILFYCTPNLDAQACMIACANANLLGEKGGAVCSHGVETKLGEMLANLMYPDNPTAWLMHSRVALVDSLGKIHAKVCFTDEQDLDLVEVHAVSRFKKFFVSLVPHSKNIEQIQERYALAFRFDIEDTWHQAEHDFNQAWTYKRVMKELESRFRAIFQVFLHKALLSQDEVYDNELYERISAAAKPFIEQGIFTLELLLDKNYCFNTAIFNTLADYCVAFAFKTGLTTEQYSPLLKADNARAMFPETETTAHENIIIKHLSAIATSHALTADQRIELQYHYLATLTKAHPTLLAQSKINLNHHLYYLKGLGYGKDLTIQATLRHFEALDTLKKAALASFTMEMLDESAACQQPAMLLALIDHPEVAHEHFVKHQRHLLLLSKLNSVYLKLPLFNALLKLPITDWQPTHIESLNANAANAVAFLNDYHAYLALELIESAELQAILSRVKSLDQDGRMLAINHSANFPLFAQLRDPWLSSEKLALLVRLPVSHWDQARIDLLNALCQLPDFETLNLDQLRLLLTVYPAKTPYLLSEQRFKAIILANQAGISTTKIKLLWQYDQLPNDEDDQERLAFLKNCYEESLTCLLASPLQPLSQENLPKIIDHYRLTSEVLTQLLAQPGSEIRNKIIQSGNLLPEEITNALNYLDAIQASAYLTGTERLAAIHRSLNVFYNGLEELALSTDLRKCLQENIVLQLSALERLGINESSYNQLSNLAKQRIKKTIEHACD